MSIPTLSIFLSLYVCPDIPEILNIPDIPNIPIIPEIPIIIQISLSLWFPKCMILPEIPEIPDIPIVSDIPDIPIYYHAKPGYPSSKIGQVIAIFMKTFRRG